MFRFLKAWFEGPSFNVDGTPMNGPIDVLGRPYGVVEPHVHLGHGEILGRTCLDTFDGGLADAEQGIVSISPFGDAFGMAGTDPFDSVGGSCMGFGGGFGVD